MLITPDLYPPNNFQLFMQQLDMDIQGCSMVFHLLAPIMTVKHHGTLKHTAESLFHDQCLVSLHSYIVKLLLFLTSINDIHLPKNLHAA